MNSVLLIVFADMIWPALFLEGRLLSVPIIIAGLVIEFFFVWRITDLGAGRAIFADLVMNATSTLLGIFLIPISGIVWEIFPGLVLYRWFNVGTFNPGTWVATFCFAVLINAALETLIVAKVFRQKMGKRGFGWLCLANGLSVGLAFASFLIYPMKG
jgi:hypothetical protein